jgi:hypothetical protein
MRGRDRTSHPVRRIALAAAGVGVLGAGVAWGWGAVHGRDASGGAGARPRSQVRLATASVVRTTIVSRQQTSGILGFGGSFQVVNELPGGVLTWSPPVGRIVRPGGRLFSVDGAPVVLFDGRLPAWRTFQIGMPDGPDVGQLERDLRRMGFDPGHDATVDDHFTWNTALAVERWQASIGMFRTGRIDLGRVAFLPDPIRITQSVPVGSTLAQGMQVLQGTSTRRIVTVSLDAGAPLPVRPGDHVVVTLPDGKTTTTGTVVAVSRVALAPSSDQSGGPSGPATVPATIRLDHPRAVGILDLTPVGVAISGFERRNVLAVPVTALVARPEGGYAVQEAGPPSAAGSGRLIPVRIGLFDDQSGLVQVTAGGLAPGVRVVVSTG